MKKYIIVWWKLVSATSAIALAARFSAIMFTVGKIVRLGMFLVFLYVIMGKAKTLVGFSQDQIILFFLTFNFVDTLVQMLLREVYRFRGYIVNGTFDGFLTKPISPLFRALFGGGDILDMPMVLIMFLLIAALCIFKIHPSLEGVVLYGLLLVNSFLMAMAFHIFVVGLAIRTTEVDSAIMMYRDITSLGRMPVDIYKEPLRSIITFVIPVGIMMTFPVKFLYGLLNWQSFVLACGLSALFLVLSVVFWRNALRYYTSASS